MNRIAFGRRAALAARSHHELPARLLLDYRWIVARDTRRRRKEEREKCHVCGFKNEALTLADRHLAVPDCGTGHHRDLNAALNIRDEGLRLLAVAGPP